MSVAHARNVVTGTLTSYGLIGVNVVLGIYLMPFTMRHLGQSEYGLWMLVASLTAYFQLLDLGYGSGVVRHITDADARGETEEINTVLSTFVVVYCAVGLVVALLTAGLIATVIPRFPTLTPEQVVTAQYILGILGLRVAIGFPMSIFGAVTTARQRFALTGGIAIVVVLVQGACTYLLLSAGYGLTTLVATTAGINVLSYGAYAVAAKRTFPQLHLALRRFSARRVREITGFSIYLFLIGIAAQVGMHVDTPIVGAYLGTSAIAVYMVAFRLAEYQRQLCGQFSGFLFPLIVRYHAQNDATALRGTLIEGTRLGLALSSLVALGLLVFGDTLVRMWMGPGFEAAVLPLYVLAVAGIVMVAQGPTGTILLGTGRHRLVAGASISECALNVATTIALIGSLGLAGVAIGTAIPYIVLNVFLLIPAACRAVNVPLVRFFRSAVVPTLVAVLPAGAAGLMLRRAAPPDSIVLLFGEAALVALVFIAAFWTLGLSGEERGRYRVSVRELAAGSVPAPTIAAS